MGLDRLLRQEQLLADFAVDEAVRDQLEHLDLAHRRLLLDAAQWALERDHFCGRRLRATTRRDLLEAPLVIHVPVENLFPLCGVHVPSIGRPESPL